MCRKSLFIYNYNMILNKNYIKKSNTSQSYTYEHKYVYIYHNNIVQNNPHGSLINTQCYNVNHH